MIPIHEIISKIRWDKEFGKGDFAIGYYDRMLNKILIVPFIEINFDPADHFSFRFISEEGETHRVPLHRVKEVYKDGALIWHREH